MGATTLEFRIPTDFYIFLCVGPPEPSMSTSSSDFLGITRCPGNIRDTNLQPTLSRVWDQGDTKLHPTLQNCYQALPSYYKAATKSSKNLETRRYQATQSCIQALPSRYRGLPSVTKRCQAGTKDHQALPSQYKVLPSVTKPRA